MGTYTFAILEVSKETFEEIAKKLMAVNYEHAFHELKEGRVLDMHGVALKQEGGQPLPKDEVIYERRKKGELDESLWKEVEDLFLQKWKFGIPTELLLEIKSKFNILRKQDGEVPLPGIIIVDDPSLERKNKGSDMMDHGQGGGPIFIDGGFDPNSYEARIQRSKKK
jgi:hypothetical protein